MRRVAFGAIGVVVATAILIGAGAEVRQPSAVSLYVTVVNERGQPVTGLGAEDFAMRDGAVRQGVIAAEPATDPIAAAVMAIGGGEAATTAATAFSKRITAANAGNTVTAPASPEPGDPVRALIDACHALESARSGRRALLVLAAGSLPAISTDTADSLLAAISASRAAVWTIAWPATGTNTTSRAPAIESGGRPSRTFDEVLAEAAATSGALRRVLKAGSDAPAEAGRVADLVLAQYVVTFLWPNPMLGQLNVTTRHDRGAVLMGAWR